ncbi:MAG: type II secretion system protein GspN [Halobacteriovoraceae bacterium]|nr:type II secretion system protein GspN [Halobacteriovoraceae bacterium]MCB9095072.1 type II secretion system protein GspN [Halobacteriovoraceae bacterium]
MSENKHPNVVYDEDYHFGAGNKLIIFFTLIILFFLGFFLTFPYKKIVDSMLFKVMANNPSCQVQFDDYNLNLLLLGVQFNNIQIPSQCLSPTQKAISFKEMGLHFGGINFSPFGIVLNAEVLQDQDLLEFNISTNGSEHYIKIQDQSIELDSFLKLLHEVANIQEIKLSGKVLINAHVKISPRKAELYELQLSSKDFVVQSQNIRGFLIPKLDLGNLEVKTTGKDDRVILEKFILGATQKPLFLDTTGSVNPNTQNPLMTQADLKINLFVSPDLLEKFSILNIVLAQFKKEDGSYQLSLKGPLIAPQTSPL